MAVEDLTIRVRADVGDTVTQLDEVRIAADRATTKECPTCGGSGKILEGNRQCPDCDGTGKVARSASPHVEIRSEPLTYRARIVPDSRERLGFRAVSIGENRSYVQDLYRSRRYGDRDALDRLQRHGREVAEERSRRVLDLPADVTYELALEARATTSSYADPPLWIIQYFGTFPRAERVLTQLAPQFPLPPGCSSVNLPRFTTGTQVGQQAPASAVPSRDVADAAVTSNVSVIAGNEDVPIQLLEQSPPGAHLDFVVFSDMEADYALKLETAALNGAGTGTSLLGLLNNLPTTYTNNPTVTYTDAAPTATAMFSYLGEVSAAVNRNRQLNGECWLMHGARAAWLCSSEDKQNRPLIITNTDGAGHFDLLTIPVEIDNAIQPIYGAGANEERIIMTRPSDYMVLESDRATDIMEDVLSGTLEVRLQLRRSVAFLCRQPSANATLAGTGCIPVSGY